MNRAARAATLAATAVSVARFAEIAPGATWLPAVRHRLMPRLSGLGHHGHLALTFDDGPDPEGTPAVLAALATLDWRATFFMLGGRVRAHPRLAAEVAAAGHELALHGDEHRYLFTRTRRQVRDDLHRAAAAVQAASSEPLRWFRPPYGVLTSSGWRAAHGLGLQPLLWSSWGRDWAPGATPSSVLREARRGILDGGTMLLHDSDLTSAPGSWRVTVDALTLLSDEVHRLGLRVGPVGEHGLEGPVPATTHASGSVPTAPGGDGGS